ncbi:MAG: RNA polymerase sigma-70 factor [Mariniphaga sp.]
MNSDNDGKDRFLLTQLLGGNESAFDFIFRKYYKLLVIYALRFLPDQDLAQSLVQDCFVRVWEKRHELNHVEDLYSYVGFMVRNQCIDHLRKAKRVQQVQITDQIEFLESATEEGIDANDLSSHLWHAVANLPERCRIAFEYSRIDGIPYTQIALKMGISQKGVEALISRALKLLRADLVDFMCLFLIGVVY